MAKAETSCSASQASLSTFVHLPASCQEYQSTQERLFRAYRVPARSEGERHHGAVILPERAWIITAKLKSIEMSR